MIRTALIVTLVLFQGAWLFAAQSVPQSVELPAGLSAEMVAESESNRPAAFDHTHEAWTEILKEHLDDGLVDYAALRKSPTSLDRYLGTLAATTPAQHAKWTRDQRFAFWINAYNAYTIQLVRDKGPVSSIKKIGGWFTQPWKIKFIPMPAFDPEKDDEKLTLDEIEHELIRPVFKDARVHAAVNCASTSCPPLRGEAFQAETLDAQLTEQVQIWLADPTRNRIVKGAKKIKVSEIFDWFSEDFGKDRAAIVRWIADHVKDDALAKDLRSRASKIKLGHMDYDWSINAEKDKR